MISDLSRSAASRLTMATQASAMVLAAGAVGLVVVGLPDRSLPDPNQPIGVPPGMPVPGTANPNEPVVSNVAYMPVDMGGLAERLGMVANAPEAPKVDTPTDEPTIVDEGDEEAPAQPFASRVRYLGMITIGTQNSAFVNIDNRQRIARIGDVIPAPKERPELGDLKIVSVTRDAIEISHEDGEAEVTLAERVGSSITMVAGGDITPADQAATDPTVRTNANQFEFNGDGTRRSEAQIDRRRRALERQRTTDPRDYDGPGLVMPDNIRRGNVGNNRRDRGGQSSNQQGNPRQNQSNQD
ncbi:MAG: hypothetical protein AB8F26_01790 [Phycisphaerales bacterium]